MISHSPSAWPQSGFTTLGTCELLQARGVFDDAQQAQLIDCVDRNAPPGTKLARALHQAMSCKSQFLAALLHAGGPAHGGDEHLDFLSDCPTVRSYWMQSSMNQSAAVLYQALVPLHAFQMLQAWQRCVDSAALGLCEELCPNLEFQHSYRAYRCSMFRSRSSEYTDCLENGMTLMWFP